MQKYLYFNFKSLYYFLVPIRAFFSTHKKAREILNEHISFRPEQGSWIKLTWLPNLMNCSNISNCHIGSQGVVETLYPDGTFDLRLNGDGGILLIGKKYKFVYLNK